MGSLDGLNHRLKPRVGQLHHANTAVVALWREHRHALVSLGLQRGYSVVPANQGRRHQPLDGVGFVHAVEIDNEHPVGALNHVQQDAIQALLPKGSRELGRPDVQRKQRLHRAKEIVLKA